MHIQLVQNCRRGPGRACRGRGTHGDGADAAGLGAHDPAGGAQAALDVIVQDELRDLRGLAAARLAADHRHSVGVDQLHQLLAGHTHHNYRACCEQGF